MTKLILKTCNIWDTDYNSDNWKPEFMTIFVTWQLRVTLDSIRNSCDVSTYQVSQEWALNTVLALNSGSWWWSVVTFWTLITGKTIAHSHFHVILVWQRSEPNKDNIIFLCFSQFIMKRNCNNLFSIWLFLGAREACLNILFAKIWDV